MALNDVHAKILDLWIAAETKAAKLAAELQEARYRAKFKKLDWPVCRVCQDPTGDYVCPTCEVNYDMVKK